METILGMLKRTLQTLNDNKPTERSKEARHWAVCITLMEQVVAYFSTFIGD